MSASLAGSATSVTKVWIWLISAMRTGALRRSLVLSATSITLRALAMMACAAGTMYKTVMPCFLFSSRMCSSTR